MNTPENKKSVSEANELLNDSVALTAAGASGDAAGIFDDEPMCMHTVVWVSSQAAKNGSHAPLWMLGKPRCVGISLKHTAWHPRAALRRTSAAARSASHSGMICNGSRRPPLSPHHSSTIQLL